MKFCRNDITADYLRERLDYDPQTGVFTWRPKLEATRFDRSWNKRWAGRRAGTHIHREYRAIIIDATHYLEHRLAWLHVTGEWPADEIDHRDGWSNRFDNLREATSSQNKANKVVRPDNKLRLKGVIRDKSRYRAQIGHVGRKLALGHFETPEAAHAAYREAAAKLHREFARS